MHSLSKQPWVLVVVLLLGALPEAALAQSYYYFDFDCGDFDGCAAGDPANGLTGGASLRFDAAAFLPELDSFGDPIPGSYAFRPDPEPFDVVRVADPSARGYGLAPSGLLALDALDQGVLVTFDASVDLFLFAVTLDRSTLGFPGVFDIVFQDFAGHPLQELPTQQAVPGYYAALPSVLLAGVSSVYLPGGAYYDDLRFGFVPVPEPSVAAVGGLALALLVLRRVR